MLFDNSKKRKKLNNYLTVALLCCSFIVPILIFTSPINFGKAHSAKANPIEIFSIWNDTITTFDGLIGFSNTDLSEEWSSAAVYNMFDDVNTPTSKILLQNDHLNVHVALDMTDYLVESPSNPWGCALYFDVDHNGHLTNGDKAIIFIDNTSLPGTTGQYVLYNGYSESLQKWYEIESGSLGIALSYSNILLNTNFGSSYFLSAEHRQYEILIPMTLIQANLGNITGFAAEAFDNYLSSTGTITWPYISSSPFNMRLTPGTWGDLYLGKENTCAEYVIEENFNIKTGAVGWNNATYLALGDIDGDGDYELIVGSNRTVDGDDKLLAIYDYIDGELIRIWSSWTTTHQEKMIQPVGILAHDFDGDLKDEIYIVSNNDNRILRLYNWNSTLNDFENSEYAYTYTVNFMGYIAIGDPYQSIEKKLILTTDKSNGINGKIVILEYLIGSDTFDFVEEIILPTILGETPPRAHAIQVGDMDSDSVDEIIVASQITNDNTLSNTGIHILERSTFLEQFTDNPEDDLPASSSLTTVDQFIHTIIIDDVDNDGEVEIIIVGKNYLRVFGKNTFMSGAPIEILINGTTIPNISGGATVGDIDGDGAKELIISASNGTIYILNVTDAGDDTLSYTIEWQSDLGHSIGYRNSMVLNDLDNDGEVELFMGDTFGQIISLGKSDNPQVTITSPSYGSTKRETIVSLIWNAIDDHHMHHFDVYINETFYARAGGAQTGITLSLSEGENRILINGFDITGKNDSDFIVVYINANSPEVTILSPENNYATNASSIILELSHFDINDDFDYYEIYVNSLEPIGTTDSNFYPITISSDGIYNITVIAVDLALNIGKDTIFIIRDTTAPSIVISSPLDGSAVRLSFISVNWLSSDALSGIKQHIVKVGAETVGTTTQPTFEVALGIDNQYIITVIAIDNAGNKAEDVVLITKDSIAPFVNITSHNDFVTTTQKTITLRWECNDNLYGTGIDRTEVTVNGIIKYTGIGLVSNIDLENDGMKTIVVTTYDKAGNSEQDAITVIVDNANPLVSIISPVNNFNTSLDFVDIHWSSSDASSGIKEYQIFIDSYLYQTITDSNENYLRLYLPTIKTYQITVRAFDFLNHQTDASVQVNRVESLAELLIISPILQLYYSSTPYLLLEWICAGLDSLTGYEIYINETLTFTINDNSTTNQFIDFGAIPLDSYPYYNVTLVAITSSVNYTAFRGIIIDQSPPNLIINQPLNNTNMYKRLIYFEWEGNDEGSNITKYVIKVNGFTTYVFSNNIQSIYLVLNITGPITISVEAYDLALNYAIITVNLQMQLLLPSFSIDLIDPFYTNTENFNFSLSITDTQLGIKSIFIYLDNQQKIIYDYSSDIKMLPFIESVIIQATIHYTPTIGIHSIRIIITDAQNRQVSLLRAFYYDNVAPNIASVSIGDQTLTSDNSTIRIEVEKTAVSFKLEVIVSDNIRLSSVEARFVGNGKNESYNLIEGNSSTNTFGIFILTINISAIPYGEYTVYIKVIDFAGNSRIQQYSISLVQQRVLPWFLQGTNLIYFAVGVALFILLTIILSVAIRKRTVNLGWRNEIVTIAYILNGLPCVYIVNKPENIKGDLLFGGAMTGIRGVLEEITGEKTKLKLQTVDVGEKKVLICPGNYGDSVLMVNKIKPIYKDKIIAFTKAFEKDYEYLLKQDDLIITPETFPGANILVQIHFRISDVMQLIDECEFEEIEFPSTTLPDDSGAYDEPISQEEQYHEADYYQQIQEQPIQESKKYSLPKVESIEELIKTLDPKKQKIFIELIQITQQAINTILDMDFEITKKLNTALLERLEYILTSENIPNHVNSILQSIFKISHELVTAINSGQRNDEETFRQAVEKASYIWIKEIGEKW